jgi:hypothetical protein
MGDYFESIAVVEGARAADDPAMVENAVSTIRGVMSHAHRSFGDGRQWVDDLDSVRVAAHEALDRMAEHVYIEARVIQ